MPTPQAFRLRFALAALIACLAAAGCRPKEVKVAAPPKPAPPPQVSEADLRSVRPNEAGAVMIVMYHRFRPDEADTDLNRKPDTFRKDLQTLYDRGYRPVTLAELVENRIDLPAGKTPVVLTFDDAVLTQFRLVTGTDGQVHIDPDCAVGIMETFSKKNPDWATKATFFVLPYGGRNPPPFGEANYAGDKMAYLMKHGYEIGSHTATHPVNMRRLTADAVRRELAGAVRGIRQDAPDATVEVLAIPYGKRPRDPGARQALVSGEEGGTAYTNKAICMAAWRPVAGPICKVGKRVSDQVAAFDPEALERVHPDPRQARSPGTLEYWLNYFEKNPSTRYVSDGNPNVAAYPSSWEAMVDAERIRALGQTPQPYSLESGAGANGLSVQ